jgi:hypothetical protein
MTLSHMLALTYSNPNPAIGFVAGNWVQFAYVYLNQAPGYDLNPGTVFSLQSPPLAVLLEVGGNNILISTPVGTVPPRPANSANWCKTVGAVVRCLQGGVYGPWYECIGAAFSYQGAPSEEIYTKGLMLTGPKASGATPVNWDGRGYANAMQLSGISVGPASVTGRRIYRSAANGSTRYRLAGIGDNVTTTYTDLLADSALTAVVEPSGDTSALGQPQGQVNAGSPTLPLAGAGAFSTRGGIARVGGSQFIRYGGVIGNSLVNIPTTGPGSLIASVQFGVTVMVVSTIDGIPASGAGAIQSAIGVGEEVNVLVIVTDEAAATALAQVRGGDGYVETSVSKPRMTERELFAIARALLAQRGAALITARYRTRDPLTRSGPTIGIFFPAPTFYSFFLKIQDVTISWPGTTGRPVYEATASSDRFAFEDLLRRLKD